MIIYFKKNKDIRKMFNIFGSYYIYTKISVHDGLLKKYIEDKCLMTFVEICIYTQNICM